MRQHALDSMAPRVLGRRLRAARRTRGFALQAAAEALDWTRATLTALEKGERRTRANELIRLAELYGRPMGDFLGAKELLTDMTAQFRASAAQLASPRERESLRRSIQEFQLLCEDYQYLGVLSGTTLRRDDVPTYSRTGCDPEILAAAERKRLGWGDGPLWRLREALEYDAGLHAFLLDLPARVSSIAASVPELGGCLAVNARYPATHRRWCVAQAYSRYLTHRLDGAVSLVGAGSRERFADVFAACFLMPASGLRRRVHALMRAANGTVTAADIARLARFYSVSMDAMTLRLEETQILRQGVWEELRKPGKVPEDRVDRSRPVPPCHGQRLPLHYRYLAVQAYARADISEGALARLLRLDRVAARGVVQELTQSSCLLDQGGMAVIPMDFTRVIPKHPSA